jgi:hypothetical protein
MFGSQASPNHMQTRIRAASVAVAATAGLLLAVAASGPASALGGNPDMLPAGSYACTQWVQSSSGSFIRGMTNYNKATFTTRMSTTLGGPETVIFTSVTREVSVRLPGNVYPTYQVLVTPPTSGTYFLRNCVEATHGALYWFRLRNEAASPSPALGPMQAQLGPGGRHCGFNLNGPSIGLGDDAARLSAASTVPVRFSVTGMDEDYASIGPIFSVTSTSVDHVHVAAANVSAMGACAENTSNTTAVVSFSLVPA